MKPDWICVALFAERRFERGEVVNDHDFAHLYVFLRV